MRSGRILTLVLVTLFVFSLVDLSGTVVHTIDTGLLGSPTGGIQVSDAGGNYIGTGSPLAVSFSGTFTNATSWTDTATTLSSDFISGTSFVVSNASTVLWTAYVLVSPPSEVESLSFSVEYPFNDWTPISVTNPIGVGQIYLTDWSYVAGTLTVYSSAVDTHGLWKIEFSSINAISDLNQGISGGALSSSAIFDLTDEMMFRTTSTWITGATTTFTLTDPTGATWYSTTNTTAGATSHLLQSFAYRKDFTVDRSRHLGQSLQNFPVLIDIIDTDLKTKVQSDGDDIVFVSGGNVLSHEIELFDQNYSPTQAHLVAWVKTNLTGSVNTVITMYYGNSMLGSQENSEDVWTNSFAAVWHLDDSTTDEQTTGVHQDATSSDYDGSQRGNVITNGIVGYGQDFDGTDDWIEILNTEDLEPTGSVTISGWFRLDISHNSFSSTTRLLFEKYLNGDNDMHVALVGSDYTSSAPTGSLVFKVENDASGQKYKYTSQTSWQANTWYYYACTMDATTPENNKIYVRAVDDTFGSYGALATAQLYYDGSWGIGGSWIDQIAGARAYLNGRMDEVRVSNGIRSGAWIAAEYQNIYNTNLFYSVSSEVAQESPESSVKKVADVTAMAGEWTVSAYYNDSGISVGAMTGMYERKFIVQHDASLSVLSPLDAVGGGIADSTVNDVIFIRVELTDDILHSGITGSEVTMNWTILGTPTTLQFNDFGAGEYGITVNTTDLQDNKRWRIQISSEHPFYNDASNYFELDLYHPTDLSYAYIETTPVDSPFTATLFYYDSFSGAPISGATITFDDGSPVTVTAQGVGWYNISISTTALSIGLHTYTINASKPGSFILMDSVDITFTLRPHYTAVSASGDFIVPYGENTPMTVLLADLDFGTIPDISNVDRFIFTYAGGSQERSSLFSYAMTLTTDTWSVGDHEVNLTLVMANSDYYPPIQYTFTITIRAHYTSINVVGDMTTPYGNSTPLTVVLTDLDTGGAVPIGAVSNIRLDWTTSFADFGSYDILLDTSSWSVGGTSVTVIFTMSSTIYQTPSNYIFAITIRSISIRAYNNPSSLHFPNGDDFTVNITVEVSEPGGFYGDTIDGLSSDISIVGYPTATITPLGNGIYNILIDASLFSEGAYSITVQIDPTSSLYQSTQFVINFDYSPADSDLTSNLYTVSTPLNFNVTVTLFYEDRDRGVGITTATITASTGWISFVHVSNGNYDVEIGVVGLSVGSHQITLTANADGYTEKSVIITVIVTRIHTDAQPSAISVDIPVGNVHVMYIDYTDLDNGVPIPSVIPTVTGWPGSTAVNVVWDGSRYEVTFTTTGSDPLGLYVITFTFTNDPNYFQVACDVEVNIRTHVTIFNVVSAPEPTPFNGIVNISLRYYDFDSKSGINDLANIQQYVWNGTHWISSALVSNTGGIYTLQIDASQFPKGIQNFLIYFNWTGLAQQYENRTATTSVNIIGIDSQLTLLQASEPTPYLGSVEYIFFYGETSGLGITNSSYGGGNVHIYVSFQGVSVDLGQVTILEIDDATQPGNYSISFSTTIFGQTGLIYMNVYINWTDGVAPFYTNRFDVISVRVLPRDTLVSIVPPTPTPYNENATLIFSYEDVTGGGSVAIDYNPTYLTLGSSLSEYSFYYNFSSHQFVFSFNTSQFSAPLGQKSFTLDVVWASAPFYANRTGRIIFITTIARQTVLDYQSPAPTSYGDSLWFILNWTDVTGTSVTGISGAVVTLYNGLVEIPGGFYSVAPITGGEYNVTLDTTYFANPGTYSLRVVLTKAEFYIPDASATRSFTVRYRVTLLSGEPIGKVPYNNTLVYTINFQDLDTLGVIGNGTGDVTLEILTAGVWYFTVQWEPAFQYYTLTIDTYNHPEFTVGVRYSLQIRASYTNQAPFYGTDDTFIFFELRSRASDLVLDDSPDPSQYLDNVTFRIQYLDTDSSYGISAESILVFKGATPLTFGTQYSIVNEGNGYYLVHVNTTALDGIGLTQIRVQATWNPVQSPYHDNAELLLNTYTVRRETNVEITTSPHQTQYLDIVQFSFIYLDLSREQAITSITATNIDIWAGGILLTSGQYSIVPVGQGFDVLINSTEFGGVLVTNFNVTVFVDWDDGSAPYYFDDSTFVRVTTIKRTMSYAQLPAESASYGELLNITFELSDIDGGWPVSGAVIGFTHATIPLTLGLNYWITEAPSGTYTIQIDTNALLNPGTFVFSLSVMWNPSIEPYYANMSTIDVTGVVQKINTQLTPQLDYYEVDWQGSQTITVNFTELLFGGPIFTPGINVTWYWDEGGVDGGLTTHIGSGEYIASIDTSITPIIADVGTYVISFRAVDNDGFYKTSYAYVTLVVRSLASEMVQDRPIDEVTLLNRGDELLVTMYLQDAFGVPIPESRVVEVTGTLETFNFALAPNGTLGYWSYLISSNGPTILDPDIYTVRLTAIFDNYEPAANSFKLRIQQTSTTLELAGETTEDMTRVYSEPVQLSVNMSAIGNSSFYYADLRWFISEANLEGAFTNNRTGIFTAILDTTAIGYGIWPITIRAVVWDNASLYADSITRLTLTIKRILTVVLPPALGTGELYWGWSGDLNFTYWDVSFGQGVPGATVTLSVPGFESVEAVNIPLTGYYLIPFDTTILQSGETNIPISVTFSKLNYQEATSIIQIKVLPVPTNIEVNIEEEYEDPSYDPGNYRIPIGESMNIMLFYNDTDDSDGFIGGLANAQLDLSDIFGPTRPPTYFSVTELGNGSYSFFFDTNDPWLLNTTSDPRLFPYEITFRFWLGNHSIAEVKILIRIIDLPTSIDLAEINIGPNTYSNPDFTTFDLLYGESGSIVLRYNDEWPGHAPGTVITNANLSLDEELSFIELVSFGTPYEDPGRPGYYIIEFTAASPFIGTDEGSSQIILKLGKADIQELFITLRIDVQPTEIARTMTTLFTFGTPVGFLLILLIGLYMRVWSVPKRLRQINAQIKVIKKGKIPKPVKDVKSRRVLITDLFNDTFSELEITRTLEEIPEDSIPVQVPEVGELLIQLSILTNLNQQELDEFKADIAKMKMSEQAAFVKEVIMQEAIRAARREGKTVEDILEEVASEADRRLAGEKEVVSKPLVDEEGEVIAEPEEEVERVFLPEEDELTPTEPAVEPEEPGVPVEDFSFTSDMLSPFEIEELEKELRDKGVPYSEIDIIVKQAKELPRELVEELIKSLDAERLRE
ncbi:MAG: hypothetical protein ACFFF9_03500 [Candidatus Thorarchaeota archaeon]